MMHRNIFYKDKAKHFPEVVRWDRCMVMKPNIFFFFFFTVCLCKSFGRLSRLVIIDLLLFFFILNRYVCFTSCLILQVTTENKDFIKLSFDLIRFDSVNPYILSV